MRFSRLLSLCGLAVAAGGFYLPSVDTETGLIAALAGTPVPGIWEATARWAQVVGLVLILGVVALVFRPGSGRTRRRLAGAGIAVLTAPVGLHLAFAYRDARAAAAELADSLDLAVFSGLIPANPGATAGIGHLVALGGLFLAALGGTWELIAPGEILERAAEGRGEQAGDEPTPPSVREERAAPEQSAASGDPAADAALAPSRGPEPAGAASSGPAKPTTSKDRPSRTLGTGAGSAVEGGLEHGETMTGGSGSRYEPGA